MTCVYQHRRIPTVRILFQMPGCDGFEKMVALRRRAEKLGYAASDFKEIWPSSKGQT